MKHQRFGERMSISIDTGKTIRPNRFDVRYRGSAQTQTRLHSRLPYRRVALYTYFHVLHVYVRFVQHASYGNECNSFCHRLANCNGSQSDDFRKEFILTTASLFFMLSF